MKTDHFVQIFKKKGTQIHAPQPEKCKDLRAAETKAERAAEHAFAVVMFSVESDSTIDVYGEPVILKRYGDVPKGYHP